jgi:hypothetical protein
MAGYGAVEAIGVYHVGCWKVTGKAFALFVDPSWSSGSFPDGQEFVGCMAQTCFDHAFYGAFDDATLINCHAQNSQGAGAGYGDGFYFNSGANNRLIGCRSDLNNNGFTFDVAIGSGGFYDRITMVGCGTQGNTYFGLNVINTSTTGTGLRAPVKAVGCTFDQDGVSSVFLAGRNDAELVGCDFPSGNAFSFNSTSGSPANSIVTAPAGSSPGHGNVTVIGGRLNPTTADQAGLSYSATSASPCVFTAVGSLFSSGSAVQLTSGSAPNGFTNGPVYYVSSPAGSAFSLASTIGGTAINSSSTGSGTLTAVTGQVSGQTFANLFSVSNSLSGVGLAAASTTFTPYVFNPFGLATTFSSMPSAPTGSTSTTLVMGGLGSTWTFTPQLTGLVRPHVTGFGNTQTALTFFQVGPRYGTGSAPANGAAVTGTRWGTPGDPQIEAGASGRQGAFSFTTVLNLTAGTAYWFDLALATGNSADQAQFADLSIVIEELMQ